MRRPPIAALLATAALLDAALVHAQSTPTIRTLVSFTDEQLHGDPHPSPNGKFILLSRGNELRVYELASRRSWTLVDGNVSGWDMGWSPRGDMVAFGRSGDGGAGNYVWTIAVDPNTGKARGAPQRVTMGEGWAPRFSADGQWIAYTASDSGGRDAPRGARLVRLSVVPVTGGPERVLARFPRGFEAAWSPDGKAIYVSTWESLAGSAPTGHIVRVRLDGGAPEVVRTGREWFPGMSASGRYLVVVPAKNPIASGDMATILDTTGREIGRVPLPVGSVNEYEGVHGDSALVWVELENRQALEMKPVAGGPPRRLPTIGESNSTPVWSPDGRRIALSVREGRRTSLAVMDADGTNPHVYRGTDPAAAQVGVRWSPDGRFAAFTEGHTLHVADVAAKTSRMVLADAATRVGNFQWRPDGQALVFVAISGGEGGRALDEVTLSGARRQLMDLSALPARQGVILIEGRQVLLRYDSAAYLVDIASKARRRLSAVPAGTFTGAHGVSRDLKWLAAPLWGTGEAKQIELFSLESGVRRVIDVPFTLVLAGNQPAFLPGDQSLLVFGGTPGDTTGIKLYSVPLDGTRPSVVAPVGAVGGVGLSLSPDGKSMIYTVQHGRTTSLLLVDLRPALSAAASRGARR